MPVCPPPPPLGGRYAPEFWVAVCSVLLETLTLFQTRQEIFKNFQAATVTNHFNPPDSFPHWIQHTSIRDENRDFGKTAKSLMKQAEPAEACTHYVMWRI